MEITIREGALAMETSLLELYLAVAEDPNGIIRKKEEVNREYITDFLSKSTQHGLLLVAIHDNQVVGEIHAYTPPIFAFRHILTDLTIVVHPNYQGQKIGRQLFERFLQKVQADYTHILRVELYVREHNTRNVQFYESLGFSNEGRQEKKIFKSSSEFETPLHMVWFNPAFR